MRYGPTPQHPAKRTKYWNLLKAALPMFIYLEYWANYRNSTVRQSWVCMHVTNLDTVCQDWHGPLTYVHCYLLKILRIWDENATQSCYAHQLFRVRIWQRYIVNDAMMDLLTVGKGKPVEKSARCPEAGAHQALARVSLSFVFTRF